MPGSGARAARGEPACRTTQLLQGVTDPESAPMAAVHEHRHRQIEHDLAGVAAVDLQPPGVGMRADAAPDAVLEDALGAVADQIACRSPVSGWLKRRLWVGT